MPNQAPPEPPKTELEEIQIQTNTVQNAVSRKKIFFKLLFFEMKEGFLIFPQNKTKL